jgi:hypothetical protein
MVILMSNRFFSLFKAQFGRSEKAEKENKFFESRIFHNLKSNLYHSFFIRLLV